jgi:hypothetical protein
MRIALVLGVVAVALGGCAGSQPGGCAAYGHPSNGLCAQSWDWYRPCDLVEGRAWRDCGGCACADPCPSSCGVIESRTISYPVVPPPPGTVVAPGHVVIDGSPPPR